MSYRTRLIVLAACLVALAIVGTFVYLYAQTSAKTTSKTCRKSILIVLFPGFRWEEFSEVYSRLTDAGCKVTVLCINVSNIPHISNLDLVKEHEICGFKQTGPKPIDCTSCNVMASVEDLESMVSILAAKYDILVIIGGPGPYLMLKSYVTEHKFRNVVSVVSSLVREFYMRGKHVASICVAPMFIVVASVGKNCPITMYSDKMLVKFAQDRGYKVTERSVETCENLITARGPDAAREFAEAILNVATS